MSTNSETVFVTVNPGGGASAGASAWASSGTGASQGFSATKFLESLGVDSEKSKIYLTVIVLLLFQLGRHFFLPARHRRRRPDNNNRQQQESQQPHGDTSNKDNGDIHPLIVTKDQNVPTYKRLTPKEISVYDGSSKGKPLLMAVKGDVFDVSRGASFYGPEGPYHNFAGRDASRGLAKNSFEEDVLTPLDEPIDALTDLDEEERKTLDDWYNMFKGKYTHIGFLVDPLATKNASIVPAATSGEPVKGNSTVEASEVSHSSPDASVTGEKPSEIYDNDDDDDDDDDDDFEKVEAVRSSEEES
ncbi:uncharacterized protein SAPINGB_P003127 [Magnusiomyces paraingens]|uniref:Cytochrome b5 heme-binding domain-containing protein n=1 Tax=Magnusiomyces paraingens TaxID=2606893 RepID=A0A5E8BJV0_9ASCO|nr:uncharacterized protein SAPINGB_P003127 [Saprochaete ingens]VVT51531.1 unnamed protein product [Saprochaete ingens]